MLTEAQAADLLSMSVRTLQWWRTNGGGPPFARLGRSVRYQRKALLAWLEKNTTTPAGSASQ